MRRLMFFTASWSTPGRFMTPLVSKLAAAYGLPLLLHTVDDRPELVREYRLANLPALLLCEGDEVTGRWVGFRSEIELREGLAKLLG